MDSNLAYQEEMFEELIDGMFVMMSPRPTFNHHHVSFNIACIFQQYLKGKRCTAIADGTDLFLSDRDHFIPDTMVVCDRNKLQSDGVHGAPDLVVEVLSPGTAKRDRGYKKDTYAAHGVREYWIVDPSNRLVEQYLPQEGQLTLHEVYVSYPEEVLARMKPEEREALVTQFQCSLYDDLDILLDDIFDGLLP